MKKLMILVLLLTLVLGLSLTVTAKEETTHEDHCVCGGAAVGVGDHTQCQKETWTPISQAFQAAGVSMSKANFSKLPSGYYYLDGDVTVTASSSIGSKKDTLDLEPAVRKDVHICLNGHNISRAEGRVFGYLHITSTLSICDCSYENGRFSGTVYGGENASHGSVIYTYSDSVFSVYGGNFVGRDVTYGGVFAIANDGCGDVDGNGKYEEADRNGAKPGLFKLYNGVLTGAQASEGGAVKMIHSAGMEMYGGTVVGGTATKYGGALAVNTGKLLIAGGTITGGTAAKSGGNIHISTKKNMTITGGVISNGKLGDKTEVAIAVNAQGVYLATYTDLQTAITAVQDQKDRYLRLCADTVSDAVISGSVYLDLCGHDLSGVTIQGKLYAMDSLTNDYTDTAYGTLTPASGAPVRYHKTSDAQVGFVRSYLALEDSGSWSFHRFYVGITKITLKPDSLGMGYKATFAGSDTVANNLSDGSAFGYKLWLTPENVVTRGLSASRFGGVQELTARIEHFLDPTQDAGVNGERAAMPVNACAYLCLADGTVIESTPVSYDFRQMVEAANGQYPSMTDGQKQAMDAMSKTFSKVMLGWDVEHFHHVNGSVWTAVDEAQFLSKLKKSGSVYLVSAGSYVLTEDVELGDKVLRVSAGTTVQICLNGHTISGNSRIFRNYGNLDICDCHAQEFEGDVISALDGEDATYAPILYAYYGSVTNLYGGNLMATGKVTAAGVVAISHDGTGTNASAPAAVFNMYGGSMSGGRTYKTAASVAVWNGAVFNMYDGVIRDGCAGESGGGVYMTNGTVNIYGGTICDNQADFGGGVYVSGGSLKIAGAPQIYNNTALSEGSNLYPGMGIHMDLEELEADAQVWLSSDAYRVLGNNPAIYQAVYSDDPQLMVQQLYGRIALAGKQMQELTDPAGFSAGFGQICINPETIEGIPLSGYGNATVRLATAQDPEDYDDLMAQVVAITDAKGQTVLVISCDVIRPSASFTGSIVNAIHAVTNIPKENIFINCSHSHSVPEINQTDNVLIKQYNAMLPKLFAQAAYTAMVDRQQAQMQTGSFEVSAQVGGVTKQLNFVRHYSYTDSDGVKKYFGDNFGTATYNSTTQHVWQADPTMHLVRFVRDGKDILMANWRIHPHRTGGSTKYKVSADVVGTTRYYMEDLAPDTHFMYVQGAAGNVNSISRLSKYNHGLDYVKYGQTLAGVIVNNLDCLEDAPTGDIRVDNYSYTAYADLSTKEEYEEAVALRDACNAIYDGSNMSDKNTYCRQQSNGKYESYYEVGFVIRRHNMAQTVQLPLNVFTIGNSVGFFTAPGELWDTVSVEVENRSEFPVTFCLGYSQEQHNYFVYYPDALDMENGVPYKSYESENRRYLAPDTITDMIDYWADTLNKLFAFAN